MRRRHLRWLWRKVQESYQSKKTDAGTLIQTSCRRISAIIRLFDKGTPRAAFICRCTFLFRPAYIRARLKFLYNRWPIVDPQHCALSATSAYTAERMWSAPHGPAQRTTEHAEMCRRFHLESPFTPRCPLSASRRLVRMRRGTCKTEKADRGT